MHWKDVLHSILESIYHYHKNGGCVNYAQKQVEEAFELQDQSELDEIDLEHYTDTMGC